MKYRILIFAFLFLLIKEDAFSQIYKATYDCVYFSNSITSDSSQMGFDITLKIRYTVYAGEKYIEITGKLMDATKFSGSDISYKEKEDKAIIDIEKQIIYFPNEQLFKKIIPYSIDLTSGNPLSKEFRLINADSSIRVSYKKDKNCFITPGLFLLNKENIVAVENIRTPEMIISLIDCTVAVDKWLDFSKIFENASEKITGLFDFFK